MRNSRLVPLAVVATFVTMACGMRAPEPPVPRTSITEVAAPFGRTWDAVIDDFASRNVPIKTIDRSSGLIVAEALSVGADGAEYADCGGDMMGIKLFPTAATYNVLVRGDTVKSTVRATVRWIRTGMARGLRTDTVTEECSTKAVWEPAFEARIRSAAEATTPSRSQ
jgi:hypothetical protein